MLGRGVRTVVIQVGRSRARIANRTISSRKASRVIACRRGDERPNCGLTPQKRQRAAAGDDRHGEVSYRKRFEAELGHDIGVRSQGSGVSQKRVASTVLLFLQHHDLDFAELDGVALGLEGDVALVDEHLAVFDQRRASASLSSSCGCSYDQDFFAVDEVLDRLVAVDLDLGGDPLVAVDRSSTSNWCSAV